jgi:hypothetical protein
VAQYQFPPAYDCIPNPGKPVPGILLAWLRFSGRVSLNLLIESFPIVVEKIGLDKKGLRAELWRVFNIVLVINILYGICLFLALKTNGGFYEYLTPLDLDKSKLVSNYTPGMSKIFSTFIVNGRPEQAVFVSNLNAVSWVFSLSFLLVAVSKFVMYSGISGLKAELGSFLSLFKEYKGVDEVRFIKTYVVRTTIFFAILLYSVFFAIPFSDFLIDRYANFFWAVFIAVGGVPLFVIVFANLILVALVILCNRKLLFNSD